MSKPGIKNFIWVSHMDFRAQVLHPSPAALAGTCNWKRSNQEMNWHMIGDVDITNSDAPQYWFPRSFLLFFLSLLFPLSSTLFSFLSSLSLLSSFSFISSYFSSDMWMSTCLSTVSWRDDSPSSLCCFARDELTYIGVGILLGCLFFFIDWLVHAFTNSTLFWFLESFLNWKTWEPREAAIPEAVTGQGLESISVLCMRSRMRFIICEEGKTDYKFQDIMRQ